MVPRIPLFLCTLLPIYVFSRPTDITIKPEAVEIVVSSGGSELRLGGSFSPVGLNYETRGDIVQVSSLRACDARRKGLDHTVYGHVAVVFVDEIQPFLTGCVALNNQARFAERSGALALVVGPQSRVHRNIRPVKLKDRQIPVVVLSDEETERLKNNLHEAAKFGSISSLRLEYLEPRAPQILKLQVFRPTLLNLCLIGLLVALVAFVLGLVFVKIRWRPTAHRDIWLRTLARSAVNKMEIRKFSNSQTERRRRFSRLRKVRSTYLPVFGSLTSVANTALGQEQCSICLEEYLEGSELRVLFCGHEFHPKCVDPWLLANRRCPLCQFDVVYKQYPKTDSPIKQSPSRGESSSLQPLLLSREPMRPSQTSAVRDPTTSRPRGARREGHSRARSLPRRRPLRPRMLVETAVRIGGYSSDVSSHIDRESTRAVL